MSVVTAPLRMNGTKVSAATMAFGSTWRRMIVKLETPSARAARTKSKFLARRNSARTTETSAIQLNSSRISSSQYTLGSMTLARMMRMSSDGTAAQISTMRWPSRSTSPPKNPCSAPTAMPMMEAMNVSVMPNSTERRKP